MKFNRIINLASLIAIIIVIYYLLFLVTYPREKMLVEYNGDQFKLITKYSEHENSLHHGYCKTYIFKKNDSILFREIGYLNNTEGGKYFQLRMVKSMYTQNDTLFIDGVGWSYNQIMFPLLNNPKQEFYFSKLDTNYTGKFPKIRKANFSKKEIESLFTLSFRFRDHHKYISWALTISVILLIFRLFYLFKNE